MKPISILISLLYVPLVLHCLGEAKYGIWAIILNIVSWIGYFDIGIGNGLRNKLTEACAENKLHVARTYVTTAFIGTFFVAVIFGCLVISVWEYFDLTKYFHLYVEDENVKSIIYVSVLFVCLNFILSLSKTEAYAIQEPGIISVVGVVGQLIQLSVLYVLTIISSCNLMLIAIIYGITSIAESLIIYFYISKDRCYLVPEFSFFNKQYLRPLLTLGISFFVMQVCSLVLNTTDNLLISNLFGVSEVTPYNIVYKVFYMVVMVHGIIIMPMWSAYTDAATRKDITWIKRVMKKINYITFGFAVMVLIGIFLFKSIAKVWLGMELDFGTVLIPTVAVYMIAQMFANNYASFLCGVGEVKAPTIISVIGIFINIPLSIYFATTCHLHLAGIILGSFFVMLMSVVVLPFVSQLWLKTKEHEWCCELEK